jgi:hypothetical protein
MIKKITTLVNTNRKNLIRKGLVLGGIAAGIVAGALLAKPDESVVITNNEDGSFTVSENPEAN